MALPFVLKQFNIYADAISLLGQVAEVGLPKLAYKTEDYQGGGMVAPVAVILSHEKLELEITCGGYMKDAVIAYGNAKASGAMWRFAGAYQEDGGGTVQAVEIITRGRFTEIDRGKAKVGDKSENKLKAALTYYKEVVDGKVMVEIDALNMIHIVNGVDLLEAHRKAIGLA